MSRSSLNELLGLLGSAVGAETKHGGVLVLRETHPAAHGVDDVLVTVDASELTLLPVATITGVVAARVRLEGGRLGHGLGAATALIADASAAVGKTIREASSTVVHERVR